MEENSPPIIKKLYFNPKLTIRENIENQIPANDEESLKNRESIIKIFEETQAALQENVLSSS